MLSLAGSWLAAVLFAASTEERIALDVIFVGNADTPRTAQFEAFLADQFRSVRVFARDDFDPADAADADVVLLDWRQRDLGGDILNAIKNAKSPLGPRDEWERPTVLLGSAGLILSIPWQLRGGSG